VIAILVGPGRRFALLGFAMAMLISAAPARGVAAGPSEVTGAEISMLARSTLVAVHHANLTGNYTVLRDLGGIHFQAVFSASAIADRFRTFRDREINLGPAVLFDAQLDLEPMLTYEGLLRVVGHFPTQPQQVIFDFTYRFELGQWRIEDLNVGLREAVASVRPEPAMSKPVDETATILPANATAPIPATRPPNR
jgi:hypothetical protein